MIIKISHLPNWANVINHDDETGYWAETESGHPVFLSPKNRIILPKKFRGQKIDALSPEDFDNLPDDDKPDAHYKSWQDKIQKDKANSKLHDGFDFTEKGNALVNRLLSFAKKYNLDDVSKMGLPESESLNFDIFNKLLSGTNHVKEVKRLGAKLAKEIKQIINSVNKINPRLAKKMNNDFVFQYKKLQQLFDFDIDAHDEKIKAKLQEKISPIRTDLSELLRFFEGDSNFITPSHAFKDLNNLVFYLEKERLYYDVIGQVYLWGEIVEHKNGYRAEFAYPKSLKIVHLDDMYSYPYVKNSPQYGKLNIEDEKQLQRNYGCEIISKDNAFAIDKV